MKNRKYLATSLAFALAVGAGACGNDSTPTTPTPAVANLGAPALDAPANDEQLDNLRPALTVRNSTSDQAGTRTYEFQVSDNTTFTAATTSNIVGFAATTSKTGVPEGANGKTSFTPDTDLQPTTVFYWRARAVQGATTSAWSTTGAFRSKLVGFNRAGELYDPLIHEETVGERVGSTTFIKDVTATPALSAPIFLPLGLRPTAISTRS